MTSPWLSNKCNSVSSVKALPGESHGAPYV
jgi:hypothetical protein